MKISISKLLANSSSYEYEENTCYLFITPISTKINDSYIFLSQNTGQYNSILSRIIHYFCLPNSLFINLN